MILQVIFHLTANQHYNYFGDSSSVFGTLTALHGGYNANGYGGSGNGAAGTSNGVSLSPYPPVTTAGEPGTTGQGNAGGTAYGVPATWVSSIGGTRLYGYNASGGGGGGGAGSAGSNGNTSPTWNGGRGGDGYYSTQLGIYVAGGGGGGPGYVYDSSGTQNTTGTNGANGLGASNYGGGTNQPGVVVLNYTVTGIN